MGAVQTYILKSPFSEFPSTPYKPFPHNRRKEAGELIAKFTAVPPHLISPDAQINLYYWWCECQFVPYDDTSVIVTNTCFIPRPQHTWLPFFKIVKSPNNIFMYDISTEDIRCKSLSGRITGTYPSVQIHPNGECFCVMMVDKIMVNEIATNKTIFQSPLMLGNGAIKYCTFSSDGEYIAILFRNCCDYIISLHMMRFPLVSLGKVICHHVCKGFQGNRSYNDSARCKFSPCGSYLAVSSSQGQLFILNVKRMSNICTIFFDVLPDSYLSTLNSYDFHPSLPGHLTVASNCDTVHFINFETNKLIHEFQLDDTVDCVKYSPSGFLLAVALRDFRVHLFNTFDQNILQTIDMNGFVGNNVFNTRFSHVYTIHMSFNQTGDVLAISSGDGEIKIFQIASSIDSLQTLCKRTMLSVIPMNKLKKLSLPKKIEKFLLVKSLC